MKNKKVIVTLLSAACIALAIVYTMMNLGGGRPGMPPSGDKKAPAPNRSVDEQPAKKTEFPKTTKETGGTAPPRGERPEKGDRGTGPRGAMQQKSNTHENSELAQIGVFAVNASSYKTSVKGYGEVMPMDTLTLMAQVSGRITQLSDTFQTGAIVKKGEVLAFIDDTDYREALSSAKTDYESAVVALEEERLQGIQASDEWRRSGLEGEPASALVLRQPQLKAAQASLDEAKQALDTAKRDLALTEVTAPFDALVVTRDVSPGSYVQSGEMVATLYSLNTAEIAVSLSPSQWAQLANYTAGETLDWPVTLADSATDNQWSAKVSRAELHQDTSTRQRNAVVTVNNPLKQPVPLTFGSFVSAEIEGRTLDNVWKIPASSVSQKQEVWLVEPDTGLLKKFTPEVLFERDGFAFITPYENTARALVVARPLNSYLENTAVAPVIEGHTGGVGHD